MTPFRQKWSSWWKGLEYFYCHNDVSSAGGVYSGLPNNYLYFLPAFLLFLISSLYLPQWCHCSCSGSFVYNKSSVKKALIFAFQECQSNFLRLFLNPCKYFSRRFLSTSVHSRIWGKHDSAACINLGKLKCVKNGKNMKNVFWVVIWVIMYVCTHIRYI